MFSKHGITGTRRRQDADLEQLKVFQDRGMVIVVITEEDIKSVITGANFISLLRSKYEKVRLNLSGRTTAEDQLAAKKPEKPKKTTNRRSPRTPRRQQ